MQLQGGSFSTSQSIPGRCPGCLTSSRTISNRTVPASFSGQSQDLLRLQRLQYTGLHCRAVSGVESVETQVDEELPNDQKIRIKLKSYWVDRLTKSVEKIREAAQSTNAQFSGPVYLPTRTRRWCVLTSPHVNKDAREHFEIRTHSRLIDVKDLTADTIDKLMNLDLPSGVDVEIKL